MYGLVCPQPTAGVKTTVTETMERRKFLIGTGALAAGTAAGLGTGAFNIVRAERDITVETVDDDEAYLQLRAEKDDYASLTAGTLELEFDELNENAKSIFYSVFSIRNTGSSDIQINVGTGDSTSYDNDSAIVWYTHDELTGSGEIVGDGRWDEDSVRAFLEPGDRLWVHFTFDGLNELDGDDDPTDLDKLTIYAEQTGSNDDPIRDEP